MSAIEVLSKQPAAQAIGWALVQFIWQGALIGVLTAAALAALRRSASDVRYVVGTIGLTLMLTMPVVTAVQTWRSALEARSPDVSALETATGSIAIAQPGSMRATDSAARTPDVSVVPQGTGSSAAPHISRWMPLLFVTWLSGVVILTLRLLSGWLWVQRMKSHGVSAASDAIQTMASRLARRLHIRRTIRFIESTAIDVPTVIGWLRPVVLVPTSALAGLSPRQLEAILAHELAHIRRHDYLVNLLQTLVETLLFYHPAVWWLSHRIRVEREHCCDDLAVTLCGDPVAYARALAELEELRTGATHFVLAASGGSLLDRVRRLLGAPSHAGRGPGWLAGTAAVLVIAAIAAGAIGSDVLGSEQATASTSPQPSSAEQSTPPVWKTVAPVVVSESGAQSDEAQGRANELTARTEEARAGIAEQAKAMERLAAEMAAGDWVGQGLIAAELSQRQMEMAKAAAEMAAASAALSDLPRIAALSDTGQTKGNFTWSHNGEKLEVSYNAAIEFTEDDKDVKSITPGGWLKIKERGLLGNRSVEFRADASGNIERRFWVGFSEKPFEPEGRAWLAEALPRFIRQTGIGAPARVARILRQKGPDGVLAEISLIEGSWAKRRYFAELLKTDKLEPRYVEQALARAGREIDSDFELAGLLIESADRLLVNDATRRAYFDAARSIGSDFEMRRVFSSALKQGGISGDVLVNLLDASTAIESDFEAASLLLEIARLQSLDDRTRPAFMKVLGTIDSDFEHQRVLNALLARGDSSPQTRSAVLDAAAQLDSDFEKSRLLLTYADQGIDDPDRFFRAVETIESSFERSRILQAVLKRPDLSGDTVLRVLRAVQGMSSSFESSQVLLGIAARYPVTGEARDLYVSLAEKLGDFEQSRVLAALVKSEKRK